MIEPMESEAAKVPANQAKEMGGENSPTNSGFLDSVNFERIRTASSKEMLMFFLALQFGKERGELYAEALGWDDVRGGKAKRDAKGV
jgi:hypothetical protein